MGAMNKLRENTGVILWILVFAFGGLWVLQDSNVFDTINQVTNDIIVVDGEGITIEQYNNALNAQLESYRQQSGEAASPQRVDMERDRVYDALIEDKLREREMDRMGITVTDEEVFELVLGDNPHSIIKAYFGDGQGGVDKTLLQNFIDDPEATEQWIQLEEYLRTERRRQKLDNLITASVRVSEADIMEEYNKRNGSVNVEYFFLRYANIPDDSAQVSDSELKKYFDQHRTDYKRAKSYEVKLVRQSKLPTQQDSMALIQDIEKLRSSFVSATDDSLFLMRYGSEIPFSSAYVGRSSLDNTLAEALFNNPQEGDIIGPIFTGNQLHLIKVRAKRSSEKPTVRAQHILFRANPDLAVEKDAARQKALDAKQRIAAGEDFDAVARELSDDTSNKQQGGDLGWYGPGDMVEPFENASFSAAVGTVVGPVETQFGMHLIKVNERSDYELQIADYALQLRPSAATLNTAQERLEDLAYYAEERGDFVQEAQNSKFNIEDLQIEEDQASIPGIGNSRTLLTFLAAAEVKSTSPVIELDNDFIIAHVVSITEEGFRPFDQVKEEIMPKAMLEKKKAIQRRIMNNAFTQAGNFEGLQKTLNTTPRTYTNLSFNNNIIPGLGRDLIFVGTVLGMKQGVVSDVIEGESAVFIARVVNENVPAQLTDDMRNSLREELLRTRRNEVKNQWIVALKETAEIQDNRARFAQ